MRPTDQSDPGYDLLQLFEQDSGELLILTIQCKSYFLDIPYVLGSKVPYDSDVDPNDITTSKSKTDRELHTFFEELTAKRISYTHRHLFFVWRIAKELREEDIAALLPQTLVLDRNALKRSFGGSFSIFLDQMKGLISILDCSKQEFPQRFLELVSSQGNQQQENDHLIKAHVA